MKTYSFTAPDGNVYEVQGPEGQPEQAFQVLQQGIQAGAIKPKGRGKAVIPGQENEEARIAELQAQPKPTLGDKAIGAGEAVLSTLTGLFSGIQAPVAGLAKSAFGMVPDAEQETARLMQQQTYQPRTEKGQDYTANVGQFMNDVLAPLGPGNLTGLAQARPQPGMLRRPKEPIVEAPNVDRNAILTDAKVKSTEGMSDLGQQLAEARYRDDQTVARLEAAIEKQNTKQPIMRADEEGNVWTKDNQIVQDKINELDYKKTVQEAAQAIVEDRQKALEQEVAQRTSLDFNAAERARREAASTGLEPWREQQQMAAEQRMPGDNTPLDFTKETSPYGLTDTPYQYRGGLDFNAAEFQSLPIEKQIQVKEAWKRRNIERQAEQDAVAKQEQRLQEMEDSFVPMEEALRDGAYKPIGDGQGPKTRAAKAEARRPIGKFGQGGAIHPMLAQDIYNMGKSVMRGADGLLKLFYHGTSKDKDFGASFKKSDRGLWFTDDTQGASEYAKENDSRGLKYNTASRRYEEVNSSSRVIPVYLDIRNPYKVTEADKVAMRSIANYQKYQKEFTAKIKQQGYDGMDYGNGVIVAFDPEQVKSALSPDKKTYQQNINRFGQGGQAPMISDLSQGIVRAGKAVKARFTGQVPFKPDTISTPRSAATIAAKQAKASKANAIGLKDSVYTSPTTFEEVKANPGKDIGFEKIGVGRLSYKLERPRTPGQDLGAGMYSAIRRNAPNNVLKYTNRLFTEARLEKIKDSVTLITGKGAYNDLLSKLTPEEKIRVAQDSLTLDKTGSAWTPEKAQKLGYSPAMKAMMDWRMKANETIANKADAVLAEQGLAPLNRRVSYASSNYDTAYTSLVYVKGKDKAGKDTTKVVLPVNGNSLWEYREALKWAKEKYKGDEFVFTKMERRGLNTESTKKYRGIPKEGLARLLDEMAKLDPAMQQAKAEMDAWIEGKTQKLYGHDVHLLRKQGLEGSIGDRPWLDAKRNAQDFFEQEVNHIEEALQYWNYQKPINEARKMAADPEIANKLPNSVAYVDRYLQHVTGVGLNPLGAFLNATVDAIFAMAGKGSGKTIANASNATREAATIWMMGVFNPTFTNVQLTQTLTGMLPEVNRIRSEFELSPATVGTSFKNSSFNLMMMASADVLGNFDKVDMAPHLKEAYQWMKEHGLTHYNEVEQSHAATQNPKWHTTKKWLSTPIWVPEKITTPQAFMWAVDMLHEGGLRGNDLYLAAYNASKKAMTEYHPDEAPMVYQRLGVVGQHVGGLKKFVHNAVDQQIAYTRELVKHPAAFTTMLGMTFLFMGAMGLAGIGTLDKLSLSMTDKGLRDHYDELFGTSKEAQGMRDGFVSVLSGFDLQTRYSMADLVPNSFGEAVAGPHLSKLYKMGASMYDYGKNRDEMSFREMAKQLVPSGMAGTLEENYLLGEQGNVLDKEAQNKYPKEFARSEKEKLVRSLGGPRPIRERLYDEQKYYSDVVDRKKTEKRNKASERMMTNLALDDTSGFQKALDTYIENDGDVSTLDTRIKTYMERRNLTSKQRAGGLAPGKSVTSIKKYERYQEK